MEKYIIYNKKTKEEFILEAIDDYYVFNSEKITCKEANLLYESYSNDKRFYIKDVVEK